VADDPNALTADELKLLESKNGVTGLSTVDVRRLLANSARLRQLVIDAAKLLTPPSTLDEEGRKVYAEIKAELER
jgi:hypothetical protein